MLGELTLAFLAGVVSFVSPCCLPMVPMYLSYLAGIAGQPAQAPVATAGMGGGVALSAHPAGQWRVLIHAAWFVAGFTAVFVALGASASVLGQFLRTNLEVVRHVSGIVIVVFGLHTIGLLRIRWLYREWRPYVRPAGNGVARSGLLGLAFGAGWTPCIGPMLGSILLLSSTAATLGQGVALLLAYALGLGVPFLLAAAAIGNVRGFIRWLNRYFGLINWLAGGLLVIMGVMVFEGTFVQLARLFPVGL